MLFTRSIYCNAHGTGDRGIVNVSVASVKWNALLVESIVVRSLAIICRVSRVALVCRNYNGSCRLAQRGDTRHATNRKSRIFHLFTQTITLRHRVFAISFI